MKTDGFSGRSPAIGSTQTTPFRGATPAFWQLAACRRLQSKNDTASNHGHQPNPIFIFDPITHLAGANVQKTCKTHAGCDDVFPRIDRGEVTRTREWKIGFDELGICFVASPPKALELMVSIVQPRVARWPPIALERHVWPAEFHWPVVSHGWRTPMLENIVFSRQMVVKNFIQERIRATKMAMKI